MKHNQDTMEKALEACRLVVRYAEMTVNCGICGHETNDHSKTCPYPLAVIVVDHEEKRSD